MSGEDIRAAAERLEELILPFERLFGKEAARKHARTYLKGLMSELSRKSIEPIAKAFGGGRMSALQKFVNAAPWRASSLFKEIQRAFGEWLKGRDSGPVVLTIHERGFAKKGRESVGVAHQWNATTRRNENSQVGIYLIATAGDVSCLLDSRLYLPAAWCDGSEIIRRRRLRTHVPAGSHHQTKTRIALDLVRRCRSMGFIDADWVVTAENFGNNDELIEGFEPNRQHFLVGVPPTEVVFAWAPLRPWGQGSGGVPPSRDEIATTVSDLCEMLRSDVWRTVQLRVPGGITHEEYAMVRVRSPLPSMGSRPLWLVIRGESKQDCESLKYYLSDAGPETPAHEIAAALDRAESASRFFQEAETYLGLGHYETRSWDGWHHHMSLLALAHWFASSVGAGPSAEFRKNGSSDIPAAGRDGF
jgi:SRSO17 transposase